MAESEGELKNLLMKVKGESEKAATRKLLSLSGVPLFVTPWTVAPRFLCPLNSPGKNTRVGCHALLQGIFPTQGLNPGLPHCRRILYHLSHQGSLAISKSPDSGFDASSPFSGASLVALTVRTLPEMQEVQVQSLGREARLAKGMATHSSILTWTIPWTEESEGLQSMGS